MNARFAIAFPLVLGAVNLPCFRTPDARMAADTIVEIQQSALSGVARVLVHAGKLTAKAAEELSRAARMSAGRPIQNFLLTRTA